MDVPVYNMQGAQVGTMPIDEKSLGGTINVSLIKQAYVMYHANLRQGSSRTKSRGDVEGSTKKIYKQKGTGRARHGDRRPPQFKGGGHVFAKRRRREHYHLDMPKKMRRTANRNALLAKLIDNEVRVIDRITFEKPKTTGFLAFLEAIKVDKSSYVALSNDPARSEFARLSARNVEGVTLGRSDTINAFNLLASRYLVIERDELEAWLKGPSSQTGKDAKISPLGAKGGDAKDAPAAKPAPKPRASASANESAKSDGKPAGKSGGKAPAKPGAKGGA